MVRPFCREHLRVMRQHVPIAELVVRFAAMIGAPGRFESFSNQRCKSFPRIWFGTSAGFARGASPTIPPFALPRKRYVKQAIVARTAEYLGNDKATYRSVVRGARLPYGYETKPGAPIDNRQLSPTTVWRWIAWLANMPGLLQSVHELIRQKAPETPLLRQTWAFPPSKYRSKQRARQLVEAARMLLAEQVFRRLFSSEMFPYYGIAHGFG